MSVRSCFLRSQKIRNPHCHLLVVFGISIHHFNSIVLAVAVLMELLLQRLLLGQEVLRA